MIEIKKLPLVIMNNGISQTFLKMMFIKFLCREMLADASQENSGNFNTLALLHELTNLEPFSAYRLFNVDSSILTSVLGTFITYFIILYQTADCST